MATIEDLVCTRLKEWPALQEKLAIYQGSPAVFYQTAPSDKSGGWKAKQQYPRMDYAIDMQADPERQSSGQATINIWCIDNGLSQEDLEPDVRAALCGVFMTPDCAPPYCLAWRRSDAYEATTDAERGHRVDGVTLLFDVYAFPVQITNDPDPIMAMQRFVKELNPEITVIGRDSLIPYYEPTADAPAAYFRITSMEPTTQTNTVVWMHATIAGHIFAPTAEDRLRWLRYTIDTLALQGEVIMLDNSPMAMRRLTADASLDPLSQGQMRMQVRFGILRTPLNQPLLRIYNDQL